MHYLALCCIILSVLWVPTMPDRLIAGLLAYLITDHLFMLHHLAVRRRSLWGPHLAVRAVAVLATFVFTATLLTREGIL